MKFELLGIFLSLTLLISGFGYVVNYAEARLPTDPCSFRDGEMTKFLKISYDPSGIGTHVCKTTLDVWGIDKPVPARCAIVAGLYLTDPACKPEPQEEPKQEPKQEPQKESQQEQIVTQHSFGEYQSGKSGGMDSGLIMWLLIVACIVVASIIIVRTLITGEFHLGASQFGDYDDK